MDYTWDVVKSTEGLWAQYTIKRDGRLAFFCKWARVGDKVEIHDEFYIKAPSVFRYAREFLETVLRKDIREDGGRWMVVIDETSRVDEKRLKYWRFMGFVNPSIIDEFTSAWREA